MRDIMKYKWMCDIIGNQPALSGEIEGVIENGITNESIEDFIGNRGNLPTNVKEFVKESGFLWTDSGGGPDSWHIGVPFNDLFHACYFLNLVTTKFSKAISCGFLKFRLMSWSKDTW